MNPKQSRYYTYIRPITRNKFVKTYSSLVFSLITISIFSYYAIRPTVTTILSLQKSIAEQQEVEKSLKDKVDNLVKGKQNYENISEDVSDKLKNMIPDNPELSHLINSLSFAAGEAEASISGIQFQPVTLENKNTQASKSAEVRQIDFTMNLQGGFTNLMQVLTTLKRLDRLIAISTINFIQPDDGALVMSVTGKAYYIKN